MTQKEYLKTLKDLNIKIENNDAVKKANDELLTMDEIDNLEELLDLRLKIEDLFYEISLYNDSYKKEYKNQHTKKVNQLRDIVLEIVNDELRYELGVN